MVWVLFVDNVIICVCEDVMILVVDWFGLILFFDGEVFCIGNLVFWFNGCVRGLVGVEIEFGSDIFYVLEVFVCIKVFLDLVYVLLIFVRYVVMFSLLIIWCYVSFSLKIRVLYFLLMI